MILFWQRLVLFTLLLLAGSAVQSANSKETNHLYFGIEQNRLPYSHVIEDIKAEGILVDTLLTICEAIDAECHFVGGKPDQLLQALQTYQLDAMLVIDAVVLPEIDKLQLTSPLCRIRPAFLQRRSYSTIEGIIHSAIIGVQQDSLLHLYLLDEYDGNAALRAYSLLENGLFDLTFGRIDALFADEAFFQAHKSQIAKSMPTSTTIQVSELDLSVGAMSVAVRQNNKTLYRALEKAIKNLSGVPLPDCVGTVDSRHESPATNITSPSG
ncbi:MAG: transporter substrate-binding domain-containing protein [Gammaproteobacteria bacterium]|nr:transporter substrate-binding domain-containing protein [Gammaproteobacteria bacterium]